MHRHHAHLVAHDVHVTLHLRFAGPQPGDEALQRRRFVPLIGQRVLEEFVQRIGRLRAEPRMEARPALVGAEDAGVEAERTFAPRPGGVALEPFVDLREVEIARLRPQRGAQRSLALPRESKELLLGQSEQRALQHAREREIVTRQQQRVGERDQVHHGDVLGQHQPVGARDLDIGFFQRMDDGVEQACRAGAPAPGCRPA